MRKFFDDLSIRSKLILLISGSVCALTASVLGVVWTQSLHQVRTIVQEQLDTDRQLFAFAQRSHYQTHVYKGTTLASTPAVGRAGKRGPGRGLRGPRGKTEGSTGERATIMNWIMFRCGAVTFRCWRSRCSITQFAIRKS
jgi:hypothetical protein